MWNGAHPHNPDDMSRRLSIEMAIAEHTGSPAAYRSYGYDDQTAEYRRQSSLQHSTVRHPQHHREWEDDHHSYTPNHSYGRRMSERSDEHHLGHAKMPVYSDDDESSSDEVMKPKPKPRGKPEAMAMKLASAARLQSKFDDLVAEKESDVVAKPLDGPEAVQKEKSSKAAVVSEDKAPSKLKMMKKRKRSPAPKKSSPAPTTYHPTMDDPIKPITDVEYQNLESLMVQFCRVPLLAEFSRPVALLHPELMGMYTKIVDHPVDLGIVCRKIRRRKYRCLRDVRLDIWRIFSNCVRYHSHPSNKEAVPSFVSIALHLREFFNDLWQEHMLPSDPPRQTSKTGRSGPEALLREAYAKRKEDRKKRLIVSGLSIMTGKSLLRAADSLKQFIEDGGCVDKLDTPPIFGDDADEDDSDIEIVVDNLRRLERRIREKAEGGDEVGMDELDGDVRKCYTEDVLENNAALQMRIANRIDRWIGKIIVPIHEATCRGVSQSSIWGCMAAAVWARESSKKPYWPALVLGIMAPEDQREEWHQALTERNEARLPEKLKGQLAIGKRKAELTLKKQTLGQSEPQSFFLVEFLGTHEFIWVREADIVENFDAAEDPNQQVSNPGNKKKRNSRSSVSNVIGSKTYASAVEEAKWAHEEFELQLQDVGCDGAEDDDDGYSYPMLCQSDDEADEILDDQAGETPDVEECNELLATEGLMDFSAEGRKNAKKRAQALKRLKAEAEKKVKADKAKKLKAEQSKKSRLAKVKERESKKELKELEKKRKKRAREREKALKGSDQKKKKRRVFESEDLKKSASGRRNLIAGKRERATAIVEGYLGRATTRNDYKSLCLGGVTTIPASLIDSTGILGMALAFRAAAGELPMPEESGDQQSNIKPWDAINVDSKKLSAERIELLEKQAGLLKKEIERVKSATVTRLALAKDLLKGYNEMEEKIKANDRAARQNPLKKKIVSSSEKKGKPKGGRWKGRKKSKIEKTPIQADSEVHGELNGDLHEPDDALHADAESSADEDKNVALKKNYGYTGKDVNDFDTDVED